MHAGSLERSNLANADPEGPLPPAGFVGRMDLVAADGRRVNALHIRRDPELAENAKSGSWERNGLTGNSMILE